MDKRRKKAPPPPLNTGVKMFERDYTDSGVVERGADPVYVMDTNDEARTRRTASMLNGVTLAPKRRLPSDEIFDHQNQRMNMSTGFKKYNRKKK